VRSAGQDEALQGRQLLVEAVAELLQCRNLVDRDPELPVPFDERHGKVGAEVEEVVLDPGEWFPYLLRHLPCQHQAELRVYLVDCAEGSDPRIGLRDASAVAEARLPRIARARVDPGEPHGLVSTTRHVPSPLGEPPGSPSRKPTTLRFVSPTSHQP